MARQPYSQCLSRAGLCDPHHVPAAQGHREALRLDRRRLLEVLVHQHINYILCKKTQGDNETLILLSVFSSEHQNPNKFLLVPLFLVKHIRYVLNQLFQINVQLSLLIFPRDHMGSYFSLSNVWFTNEETAPGEKQRSLLNSQSLWWWSPSSCDTLPFHTGHNSQGGGRKQPLGQGECFFSFIPSAEITLTLKRNMITRCDCTLLCTSVLLTELLKATERVAYWVISKETTYCMWA